MKKPMGKKLALSRETLAALTKDALDVVAGGQEAGQGITVPQTRLGTLCNSLTITLPNCCNMSLGGK